MLTLTIAGSYDELLEPFIARLRSARSTGDVLGDSMTPEWIITPSLGVRRWLTTHLAAQYGAGSQRQDGVAANIQHEFPSRVTGRILDAHLKQEYGREIDPWGLPQLQFHIYDWASRNPSADGRALCVDGKGNVLLSRCRHVADLIDRYITWRPDMLRRWIAGDVNSEAEKVQADLFTNIRHYIAIPSPAERWSDAWSNLDEFTPTLPARDRLTIFGLSSFPGGQNFLDAVQALARTSDVALYLVQPLDGTVATEVDSREDFTEQILQMWGGTLVGTAKIVAAWRGIADHIIEIPATAVTSNPTVLSSLHKVLRGGADTPTVTADASVIFHETYGESRQCDVLRDAIRHDLANTNWEPPLQESEILVVCPDLATFAPLILSSFGPSRTTANEGDVDELAYRISDRSITSDGPYLRAIRHFMLLVRQRCTRSEVLGFLGEAAVVRARRFSSDAEELYASWTKSAAIRWGLDEDHRKQFALDGLGGVSTWSAGLQRLILGSFIENPSLRAFNNVLPVEIAPAHFEDLVALTYALEKLTSTIADAWSDRTLGAWLEWFDDATHFFIEGGSDDDREVERVLGALVSLRDAAPFNEMPIAYGEFAELIEDALNAIGSVGSLFTGGITITSPDTLRGVTFRSIYILGMDDEAFVAPTLERDDLRRLEDRLGDVSPSDDARSRLREIITAASERLTILRTGVDVATNQRVEAGTAFSELNDALKVLLGSSVSPITVTHPRNSFSLDNFDAGESQRFSPLRDVGFFSGAWSRSQLDYLIAQNQGPRSTWATYQTPPSVADSASTLSLNDLTKFLKNPPQQFVQRTLGITLPRDDETRLDDLDISTKGLLDATLLTRLWENERAGDQSSSLTTLEDAIRSLIASGDSPPTPILDEVVLTTQARGLARLYRQAVGAGRREHIRGTVDIAYAAGDPASDTGAQEVCKLLVDVDVVEINDEVHLVEVVPRKLVSKKKRYVTHVIEAWVRLLGVCALEKRPVHLQLIHLTDNPDAMVTVASFRVDNQQETAQSILAALVSLYEVNLKQPVPFAAGEPTSVYEKPQLTDARWTHTEYQPDYRAKYLGDPYWALALGQKTAQDIFRQSDVGSFRKTYGMLKDYLNSLIPLFAYVDGKSTNDTLEAEHP